MKAQEYIPGEEISKEKVYKDKEVWVAAYLGGPLTAGYLIAENYKVFGEKGKAKKAMVIAAIVLAVIIAATFFMPYADRIPSFIYAILYAGTGYALVQIYQGEKIRAHIHAGGKIHSWYRTLAVSVIGLVITAVPLLGISYVISEIEAANETTKTYGKLKHEIAFNKNNISEAEIETIAQGFKETTFFDDEVQKFAYVRKIENSYEIYFIFNKEIRGKEESLKPYELLRDELQKLFPNNKIVFVMTVDTLDNAFKRIDGNAENQTPKIIKIQ